jgi:hypothetical protein
LKSGRTEPGAFDEERDSGRRVAIALRRDQRRDRKLPLAANPQRLAAGEEQRQYRQARDERGDAGGAVDHVLGVVHDHEGFAAAELIAQRVRGGDRETRLAHAAGAGQRDQADVSAPDCVDQPLELGIPTDQRSEKCAGRSDLSDRVFRGAHPERTQAFT